MFLLTDCTTPQGILDNSVPLSQVPLLVSLLVSHRDEVLSQLLCDNGRLLRNHGLLVHTHDQGLHCLDTMHPSRALLPPDHSVVGGEEHVLGATHHQPVHRHEVSVSIPVKNNLKFSSSDIEAGTGSPDIAIVAGNHGILDHISGDQLIVNVALPAHVEVVCNV